MGKCVRTDQRMPERLRESLEQIFGERVGQVELVENSIYCRLHLRARATTRRNRILLIGTLEEFFADPELILHEYYHVLRQWNRGRMSVRSYLLESFVRGYRDNRFERQARRFSSLRLPAFQRLLVGEETARSPSSCCQDGGGGNAEALMTGTMRGSRRV